MGLDDDELGLGLERRGEAKTDTRIYYYYPWNYSGDHAPLEYIAVHSIVLYVYISRVPVELINRPPPFSHSFFFFQF